MLAIMTGNGQVRIPRAVRERLGLRPGAVLDIDVDGFGEVVIRVPGGTPAETPLPSPLLTPEEVLALTGK